MDGHKYPLEDERVFNIEADEDQDTRKDEINDNDNDTEEGFYDQPKKPLRWPSYSSAPGKDITSIRGLYIDRTLG